jgi:hypothetical protein
LPRLSLVWARFDAFRFSTSVVYSGVGGTLALARDFAADE